LRERNRLRCVGRVDAGLLLHRWIEKESVKQFRIIRGKLRIPLCINDSSVDEVDYAK
jgi:hypothetical protein